MAIKTGSNAPDIYPRLDGKVYDWPIWRAIEHVSSVIADLDADGCYPSTRTAIRQAALDGHIALFGRQELPPPKQPGFRSEVWTLIEPAYWRSNALAPLATDAEFKTHDHTWPEPLTVDGYRKRYWSVVVNRDQVFREFPGSRLSHVDCVRWCEAWIMAGKGNGENKAWLDFKADPAHTGLSRDNVFRPAWKQAKTKSE